MTVWFLDLLDLWHYTITDRKSISAVVKLSATHIINFVVLRVNFGLTSYEELPPALLHNTMHNGKLHKSAYFYEFYPQVCQFNVLQCWGCWSTLEIFCKRVVDFITVCCFSDSDVKQVTKWSMHVWLSEQKPAMFACKLKFILLPQLVATLNNYSCSLPPLANVNLSASPECFFLTM